jgi:hypothetical protein
VRRILGSAAFALAAVLPSPAIAANTWGTDLSDLWWNADESGWGVNVSHQGDILFLTIFVYGSDDKAKWYVGPAIASEAGTAAFTFTGQLFETTGPYRGRFFSPDEVENREVGTVTITFPTATAASLSYNVDGVFNTKWVERQTFRTNNLSGSYIGATVGSTVNCGASTGSFARPSDFLVNHSGTGIVIAASAGGISGCTYSGNYVQNGRMGRIAGVVSCANGQRGDFQAFETESGYQGFVARYVTDYGGGCTETGRIGGVMRD